LKKIIILIIMSLTINAAAGYNEIEFLKCGVSEISSSNYTINFLINNTFDSEAYSKLQVVIPFEKYILQGKIESGKLKEKDFLFSQIDIDLNGNKDFNDKFKVQYTNNKLAINGKPVSPLFKKTVKYNAFLPFGKTGNFNINNITSGGAAFTLRNVSPEPLELTLGLSSPNNIEFRKFPNNAMLVEVITADKSSEDKLLIDGNKPFMGITNEKEITDGENLYRFVAVKNLAFINNSAAGDIKIAEIKKPFSLRLTYYFTISDSLILMNQKIIRVN